MQKFNPSIFKSIKEDIKNRTTFFIIESVATICGVVSALLLATLGPSANFYIIWCLYLISSLGFIYIGYIRKSFNIVLLMIVYSVINIVGLFNTIFN